MTTYAVIGAGAIGCFYGIRLAQAGGDVHFVLRSRADTVRADGLRIKSPTGDVQLTDVNVHESAGTLPTADVVVVAVKATNNTAVLADVAGAVKPEGSVLLIQNGIGGEPLFRSALPESVGIVGGLAFISSQLTGPNVVTHFDHGQLTIGRYLDDYAPGGTNEVMLDLKAKLEPVGVPVDITDDLLMARWQKLMWNLPFNGLCVALDALTTDILNSEPANAALLALMAEVYEMAKADGKDFGPEFGPFLADATREMAPYSPSMKVDADLNREMEVEAIIGNPVRRAKANGIEVPNAEQLYRMLQFRNDRIASTA